VGITRFIHCTIATYSNDYILHKDPVLLASNYINVNNVPQTAPLNALFQNCIFWGEGDLVDDEVVIAQDPGASLAVSFDYGLWKIQKTDPSTIPGVTTKPNHQQSTTFV
jgi:hypothetical protein